MTTTLDFSQARFKHLNWKFRIRNFLNGKETLTKDKAVDHHQCDLGKWFYSEGKAKYGHLTEMLDFEKAHEELHITIKDIVHLKETGKPTEAEEKYKDILRLSDIIVRLLDETEKKIIGTPANA